MQHLKKTPPLRCWLLAALVSVTTPGGAAGVPLIAFVETDARPEWRIVNDTVMGGRSSSSVSVRENALHFTGTLNTNGGGFTSVRSGGVVVNADDHDLILVEAMGDGRDYQLRLTAASTGTTYRASFPTEPGEWRTVALPLDGFQATWRGRLLERPPIQAKEIGQVGVMLADGKDGQFSISIRQISLGKSRNR